MKKQLLFLVMMLLPMVASAGAVEINGIYYNLITKFNVAEVTSNPYTYQNSIVIPETVNYNNVTYSVTSIGESAFYGCLYLTSITIPNSVTNIGHAAFSGCEGLISVTIPTSVTSIGSGAFGHCSGLTSITIGSGVTNIGKNAFFNCSSLKKVIVPDVAAWCGIKFESSESNPLYYAHHVYSDENTEIKDLIIPNSVTNIWDYAFQDCCNLDSVTIPNSVTSIGKYAFQGCSNLAFVTIGNSVMNIWDYAFQDCCSLISITIPNSVTRINDCAFKNCSGLISVTLPNRIKTINDQAFNQCSSLTSITIPNSVTSIGKHVFSGCSWLTSVTIGNGIQRIDDFAFAACPNLTDVTCYAEKENDLTTSINIFAESYIEYATLHVPSASVNAYKAIEPWKNFKSIVAIDGEIPTTQKCEKPIISYVNGQLQMSCATEGVEYITEITDADVKKHYDATISLTATYNISVYATKSLYENSETATATLCWIDATPQTEGITNGVANIPSKAVLIQSEGGILKVEGIDEGTPVSVYTLDGKQAGSAVSRNGAAFVGTNIQPGNATIIKIGDKSIKVVMK